MVGSDVLSVVISDYGCNTTLGTEVTRHVTQSAEQCPICGRIWGLLSESVVHWLRK